MKKTYLVLIIFVVIAAIIAVVGYFIYQNRQPEKSPTETSTEALPTEEGETFEDEDQEETTPSTAEITQLSEEEYSESYIQEQNIPPEDPESQKIPNDFPDELLYSGNYKFIEVDDTIMGEGSAIPNRVIFFSYDKPENVATFYVELASKGWSVEKEEIPEQKSYYYVLEKDGTSAYINIDPSGDGTELIIRYY